MGEKGAAKVHFVGILGVSMSALAKYVKAHGYEVSGSDIKENATADELRALGIDVKIGHDKDNVADATVVVYTDAVGCGNPELEYAERNKLKLIDRASLLGSISRLYPHTVAVGGTHGKTTTTAMIAKVFKQARLQPTVHIGVAPGMEMGENEYFVTEACEYKRNLLKLQKECCVITNIDRDHMDYFKDMEDINSCFTDFAFGSKFCVVCGDDERAAKIGGITYGLSNRCQVKGENVLVDAVGRYAFDVVAEGEKKGRVQLKVLGKHNVLNALAACAVGFAYGIEFEIVKTALESYAGCPRRMQYIGRLGGAGVISDYAHHPNEIAAIIEAVKNIGYNRLFVVYEPHTYTRLKALLSDFCRCFTGVYELFLLKIYAAREKRISGVSSKKLCKLCRKQGMTAKYFKDYKGAAGEIVKRLKKNDLLLVLGAGDIYKIIDLLNVDDNC